MKKTGIFSLLILLLIAILFPDADKKNLSVNELMELDMESLLNIEVISASKKKEKLFTAPATVYVISGKEIEMFGFLHLQDALAYVPSVYLYNPHSWVWGGQRGLISNFSQTILMVNGREVNNIIANEGFISRQFATHNIERIEIIASPGSVLYGANALAGVINIITKDNDPGFEGIELKLSKGSFNTTSASLLFGKVYRDLSISGSIRLFSSDEADFVDFVKDVKNYSPGWADNSLSNRYISNYDNRSEAVPFSIKGTYKDIYFGVMHYYNKQSHGMEKLRWDYVDGEDHRKFTMAFAGFEKEINEKIKLKIEYQNIWSYMWGRYSPGLWPDSRLGSDNGFDIYSFPEEVLTSTGEILHGDDEIIAFYESFAHYLIDQGIIDPDNITSKEIQKYFQHIYTNRNSRGSRRKKLDLLLSYAVSPYTAVDLGYSFDNSDYVGLAVTDAAYGVGRGYDIPVDLSLRKDYYDSTKHGAYFQLRQSAFRNKVTFHLGCRYDHQNFYGGTLNPRMGMIWKVSDKDIFKFLYGEAFREPNVFELSGDPYLKPAKLRSFELNYSRVFGETSRFGFTVYSNTVSDYLNSVGSLIGTGIGVVEKQRISGAEFQLNIKKNPFMVFVNGAFIFNIDQEVKDDITGEIESFEVLGIPKTKINLGLSYNIIDRLSLNLLYIYTGSYMTFSGNTLITDPFEIDNAGNLRLSLYWEGLELAGYKIDLQFAVNNFFDSEFYHPNIRRSGPHKFLQEGRTLLFSLRIRHP